MVGFQVDWSCECTGENPFLWLEACNQTMGFVTQPTVVFLTRGMMVIGQIDLTLVYTV